MVGVAVASRPDIAVVGLGRAGDQLDVQILDGLHCGTRDLSGLHGQFFRLGLGHLRLLCKGKGREASGCKGNFLATLVEGVIQGLGSAVLEKVDQDGMFLVVHIIALQGDFCALFGVNDAAFLQFDLENGIDPLLGELLLEGRELIGVVTVAAV